MSKQELKKIIDNLTTRDLSMILVGGCLMAIVYCVFHIFMALLDIISQLIL